MPNFSRAPRLRGATWILLLGAFAGEAAGLGAQSESDPPRSFGGVYPHLASFNDQNECGIGAVVPWAGHLWWLTYAPHRPDGSDDKLASIGSDLTLTIHAESIGGTPANRLIHRASQQLFMGPYAIDRDGNVRAIPYSQMRGRHTGTARHLSDPEGKVYTATMEEGLYEIDVETLEVTRLFADTHDKDAEPKADLPGYHGKGLYSGQGVLVYSNNGEYGREAQTRPDIPSGVLAEWNGDPGTPWKVVLRNQFTEVTGPGGIEGNADAENDAIWAVGWDHRSVILMLRSAKGAPEVPWHRFRLPKASHCYDGAHGWNTEWPRIRDIGEDDLLMTMHGTLWRFPRTFDLGAIGGIRPRSTYLRVVGDFCRWGDRVVFGCDDAARSEFLNTRRLKGEIAGPAESQSNLWFVDPEELDRLGPPSGRGAVWVDEPIPANTWSDPMLVAGYDRCDVAILHAADGPVVFRLQTAGPDGIWSDLVEHPVRPGTVGRLGFDRSMPTDHEATRDWIRVAADRPTSGTVQFTLASDRAPRDTARTRALAPLRSVADDRGIVGGLLRAGSRDVGLQVLATQIARGESAATGYYELTPSLALVPREETTGERTAEWMAAEMAIPTPRTAQATIDPMSVLVVDETGARWRLPVGHARYLRDPEWSALQRTAREVVTERDLVHLAGTFYELPARNAGGIARIRPIASHDRFVQDFCSWRGMLALTGVAPGDDDPRVVRSEDGKAAVWLGTVDDLWHLGPPRAVGAVWRDSSVEAGEVSDPMLVAGYDPLQLSLAADRAVTFTLECDLTGSGTWGRFGDFEVDETHAVRFTSPPAYWIRLRVDRAAKVTAAVEPL